MIVARDRVPALLWLAMLSMAGGCATPAPASGLRPLPLYMASGWTNDPGTRDVDSHQPTLRWEAFPRPEDLRADSEGKLANVGSVTYELRIWRAEDGFPAELVYARAGLSEPNYRVETPLAPDTLYLWSIRTRFDLNGQPRVTQWGVTRYTPLGLADPRSTQIPSAGYYRLKTPKQ